MSESSSGSKVLIAAVAIAGVVALAGYLSERGFRIARVGAGPEIAAGRHESGRTGKRAAREEARAGKKPKIHIGHTPIPLLVDGKAAASLVGDTLAATLTPVSIISKHDVRNGWAIEEILAANGVTQTREVVFTDKQGKSLSAGWAQVIDRQHRLILTYSRNGVALLFSGPVLEDTSIIPKKANELAKTTPDLIVFPNLATIEAKH
jgi:hypothetical protein